MSYAEQIRTEANAYTMRNLIANGIEENKSIADDAVAIANNKGNLAIETANGAMDLAEENDGRINNIIDSNGTGLLDEIVTYKASNSNFLNKIANEVISSTNLAFKTPILSWLAYRSSTAISLGTKYKLDINGDLESYVLDTAVLVATNTGEEIDVNKPFSISYKIPVDTTKSFGTMIGFSTSGDPTPTNRFLVGYEPAHTAIEIYYAGIFYKVVDAPAIGEYQIEIIKNSNTNIVVKVNGVEYPVANYVSVNLTTLKYLRIQTKQTVLGLFIRDYKANYINKTADNIKNFSTYGAVSGRNVHVYEFGGKGNNWCFVRTPPSYDPKREKPYPFVICNHGNGWGMNGALEKANWTKRTMYVQSTDTDYIANPTQYNLVPAEHPEYLYSNPTIEALLAAGYIVCGAQNYGDGLYGNDDCRQACADFYEHMIKSYNVESKCFMIGASNGAMTSLNAMFLLGGVAKIKAMILQYPLTCLWRHYSNYSAHQNDIETAYGIAHGLTESQFEKATRTHDPEKVCTITGVNGVSRYKTMAMPPIKIWYSLGDSTTIATHNALALIQLLEDSNCIYESVVATGEHGDYSHFDPTAYVNWFEKWR